MATQAQSTSSSSSSSSVSAEASVARRAAQRVRLLAVQRERLAAWRDELRDNRWVSLFRNLAAVNVVCSFVAVCGEMQVLPVHPETALFWARVDAVFVVTFFLDLVGKTCLHVLEPSFYFSLSTIHLVLLLSFGVLRWHDHASGRDDFARVSITYSCLRALRIARLLYVFRESELLNIILLTLRRALGRTFITLGLMTVVAAVYAVVGVALFRHTSPRSDAPYAVTGRGLLYEEEYWGTFSRALWTLFQVFTFESWSEAIARPLLFDEDGWRALAAAIFFPSYIFFNSILLLNVLTSIAVAAITSASEFDLSRKKVQNRELREILRRERLLGSASVQRMIARHHAALLKDEAQLRAANAAATRIQRHFRGYKVRKSAAEERKRIRTQVIPFVTLDNAKRIQRIEEKLERLLTAVAQTHGIPHPLEA